MVWNLQGSQGGNTLYASFMGLGGSGASGKVGIGARGAEKRGQRSPSSLKNQRGHWFMVHGRLEVADSRWRNRLSDRLGDAAN